ncbi:hypothetical protein [Rufibacter sp. LB8]|uniref:hypothetical protein n=1 Tax=Rufibacter sp. LB8 TaxID=2777781 RepID=UPI00178C4EDD|nr:hypothetical protein [Rufibacter sp. LB8]
MKNNITLKSLLLLFCGLFAFVSCEESEEEPTGKVTFVINPPEEITATSAVFSGEVTAEGNYEVEGKGMVWSINPKPTLADDSYAFGSGPGEIMITAHDLSSSTTYYVRVYSVDADNEVTYSQQETFTTLAPPSNAFDIITNPATAVTASSATVSASIVGTSTVIGRGICWSKDVTVPTVNHFVSTNGSGPGVFSASLTGLTANAVYYARAYAVTSVGTVYGNTISFTASSNSTPTISVTTDPAQSVTTNSAIVGGVVTGSAMVTARGICYNTAPNPTTSNSKTTLGSGTGSFNSNLTGLTAGTLYYARAYATTSAGTTYGNSVSFTTVSAATPLAISTAPVTGITTTAAASGGTITGTGTVTARGVCWSTSANPTTSNSKTSNGTGTGSFASAISGLEAGKTYYVRAYAITSAGITLYGSSVSFATPAGTVTVVTNDMSFFQTNSSASIKLTGTAELQSAGVCWSKSPNPTINNSKTQVPNFRGNNFTYNGILVPSLESCTKYYLRAYAITTAGVVTYGNEINFKSPAPILGDCSPLNGVWERSGGAFVLSGSVNGFKFTSFATSTDKLSWYNAFSKGLVGLGGYYISNLVPQSSNTWKCSSLWLNGTTTGGVTEVKYGTGTLTMSADEKSFTVVSTSPFSGTTSSATFTKR